ncbi:MAG: FtsH protease activity modulator HflK [Hyphomonadaceae bacterium]
MPFNDDNNIDPPKQAGGPWGSGSGGSGGSGGGNGGSPWNKPGGGSGGGSGGGGGSDLEEQMRRMQERFRGRGGKGRGGKGGGGLGKGGFGLLALAALAAWLFTGVVIVDAGQQASIFRFGKFQTNFAPGFHLHWPAPLEQHIVLPVEQQNEISIGTRSTSERLMLTGDENIVDVQFSVFWKIDSAHPEDYILNVDDPQEVVKAVAESVMREVVGKSDLQDIITTERAGVQTQVRDLTQALLIDYDAGVEILDIQIAKADAPEPVIDAFLDVVNAAQDATTLKNQATTFANQTVPVARGDAQVIIQEAEAYREQVIADATGQASRFEQIYDEYRKAPRVTRERMFLETMESVLGRSDKTILDSDAGAVPYLPLDRLGQRGQ